MDVASLSYFLSKQVLNSVKIVGNTGFQYNPSFAMTKDKQVLQSILEKGLSQISIQDRSILTDKWVALSGQEQKETLLSKIQNNFGVASLITLFVFGIIGIILFARRHRHYIPRFRRKTHAIHELKDEVADLEDASRVLVDELEEIKGLEEDIKQKIKNLE